ncbi:hypothetical protein DY000_02053923 [Brassica cretica]|uniref:Uncharacterized protein n=1 Tax=Brassica cretica TaxID=69181 RepID=A0ABQ7ADR4_BRACR|nr:hypothetical protein DY000_02053923 [Brassica cretica]
MQLDTQKHEARVSRCKNTRHAEGQVDVEVSSGMAREHATGHVDIHVSPRMRLEASSRYQDEDLEGRKRVPDIGDGFRARIAGPPPASPIEDRGTAILIEDRDRAIPKRLRLCGVIVKGLSVSLVEEE